MVEILEKIYILYDKELNILATINVFLKLFNEFRKELKYLIVDRITRLRKVNRYLSLDVIRLNLGFGYNFKKGFINIDINKNADLRLDLRKALPFKNNSVDYIYSEHFFEHLDYYNFTALRCLHDYYRVLKQGARLRIVIPDMENWFKAYVNKDLNYFEFIDIEKLLLQFKKFNSFIDYLNYGVYTFGEHKYSYDFDKIKLMMELIGFKNITRDKFNPKEDTESRKNYSLYIQAIKK